MARPLRVEFAGALYHVTALGNRREPTYEDDDYRKAFLVLLAEVSQQHNWLCHAYSTWGQMNISLTGNQPVQRNKFDQQRG